MKRILMIAPACYLLSGAESIVNLKLLKAMTNSGQFQIDLISKCQRNINYPSNTLEDLGISLNSLHVIEVDNSVTLSSVWQHLLCLFTFGFVYKGSHWAVKALKVAKRLVKESQYDYVLTKNDPAPLVAIYLKKHFHTKWVATWNDPYPKYTYPQIYSEYFNAKPSSTFKRLLKKMQKYVDGYIFPSINLKEHMSQYMDIPEERTYIIPHVVNRYTPPKRVSDDTLRIIHSGNFRYPRNPKVFLEALSLFFQKHPESKVRVDVLGVADDNLSLRIHEYHLENKMHFLPAVSYLQSLELLSNYDVALIIEAQCPNGIFLPTKVSDFMQMGKTIFAVSPKEGVLHDLYENGNIGYFADNTDMASVAATLEVLYDDFVKKQLKECRIPDAYTEESVTKQYLNI